MKDTKRRSFWALMATQFFGAFNDNVFQIAVALLAVKWVADPAAQNKLVTASGVLFAAPFLIFSLLAGRLADRLSKTRIVVLTKLIDLPIVAVVIAGMYFHSLPMMLGGLFLLGLQSTFFAPAKYGILPELMTEAELSRANGALNVASFTAILTGTIIGTFYIHNIHAIAAIMFVGAVASIATAMRIAPLPAANPTQPLAWNPLPDFFNNWRLISGHRPIKMSLIAVSYFWFVGGVLHLNMLLYVNTVMRLPDRYSGFLLAAIVIGIAIGSWLAGHLSREKVELGLVPIGALGTTLFTVNLAFSHGHFTRTLIDAFLLGAASGIYVIPLNTLIQLRSPKENRGRILATANFLSFIAILAAMGFLRILGGVLNVGPAGVFFALGAVTLAATVAIVWYLPQAAVRLVFYVLANMIYRLRVIGRENVPITGPALLVPNHVSMIDPFLIGGALSRLARCIMYREMFDKPFIRPFVKLMDVIPISESDPPKEIMRSLLAARKKLEEGHLVCLFAEGQMSRLGGTMLGFRRGLEVILKGLDVPVIPVHLEGVWGSIFSYERGKFLWKWPRRFPYPITITFGEPLKNPDAQAIRQAVMDLGSTAFAIHRQKDPTLFDTLLSQAKDTPDQIAMADSSGEKLTYHRLLTAAALVGERLEKVLGAAMEKHPEKNFGERRRVGVLLPPSNAGAIANVALVGRGYLPINLNYTLTREGVLAIADRAQIRTIVTSAKMLEKLGWEKEGRFVLLETVTTGIARKERLAAAVRTRLFPRWWLRRTMFAHAPRRLDELATVMFTSGSTGVPKGVMLTEANVLSNIQALRMVLSIGPTDAILGVMPFFHSFGFTAGLWFPLLACFKAVYHTNPLDSKTIGELCYREKVTFLMGTPTFVSAYLRRVEPADFATLRFAVVGAEKLRPELAKAFEEKFNIPLLEGYGCTELSPVVALNVPDIMDGEVLQVGRKVGKIGRPLPGVAVRIVDPDSGAPLRNGTPGLLLVRGPNVMKGYLDDPEKTAEVVKDGWYVTGDIATLDDDGFLEITDRLSRFSKIGGEMVPHILVEQKLHALAGCVDRTFVVTSVSDEKKGEALVVLVTGYPGDVDALWKAMNASDLPKLWIPARKNFFTVESFPALGSGKLDMPKVKEMAGRLSAETG